MGKYVSFLKETDLFYNLTPTQLEMVESICEERHYLAGDVIFEENSNESDLYLVWQGQVEIFISPSLVSPGFDKNLASEVISTLWRGQSFGEIALVDEGVRTAGVRAVSQSSVLLRIPRSKFLLLCSTYPELGYQVMFNLASDLAQKIRNADLKIREGLLYQQKQSPKHPTD